MAKRFTKKSFEEKRAEVGALQDKLSEQVSALGTSEEWMRYLTFCSSFHSYSFRNRVLIMLQLPTATQVASFTTWKSLHRKVTSGPGSSLRILRPQTGRKTVEENGEEVERRFTYFVPASVFDISQTEMEEGYEDETGVAGKLLEGDDDMGMVGLVEAYVTSVGYTFTREPVAGSANGYTTPGAVVIDSTNSEAQQAKTAIHEAAHIALGHIDEGIEEYREHRGMKEVEAESVAYVVAGYFGIDTSSYSVGYVTGWAQGDNDLVKKAAERVTKAADTIIEAIEGSLASEEGSAEAA